LPWLLYSVPPKTMAGQSTILAMQHVDTEVKLIAATA
jgi:hypothetical protein